MGPLAVRLKPRQRYPTAGRPLGTRTLRRHGSYRPRGGIHPHPRSRMKRSRGPATEPPGPDFNVSSRRVGVSNRQAGASGDASLDRGDPACGPRRGIGDAASCGHRGAPARDALLGRGRGSLGAPRVPPAAGRASDEEPRTRLAKEDPWGNKETSRSERERPGCEPAWQNTAVTQWKHRSRLQARGARGKPWDFGAMARRGATGGRGQSNLAAAEERWRDHGRSGVRQ